MKALLGARCRVRRQMEQQHTFAWWPTSHRDSPVAAQSGDAFDAPKCASKILPAAELFGAEVGRIAAALWAFNIHGRRIGSIAKEDTFVLFFFLLGNILWLRGQRVAETKSTTKRREILLAGKQQRLAR